MKSRILTTIPQMLNEFETMQFLYPELNIEKYKKLLEEMVPHNYKQAAIFQNDVCIGITGFWTATKLWTGRYIEIDNFVVHPLHRQKGVAKLLCQFVEKEAKELGINFIVLDAFTQNFIAHKLYYNLGYEPRGFHFVKKLNN